MEKVTTIFMMPEGRWRKTSERKTCVRTKGEAPRLPQLTSIICQTHIGEKSKTLIMEEATYGQGKDDQEKERLGSKNPVNRGVGRRANAFDTHTLRLCLS